MVAWQEQGVVVFRKGSASAVKLARTEYMTTGKGSTIREAIMRIVVVALLFLGLLHPGRVWCTSERDLYEELLSNYSTKVRPVKDFTETIEVSVELNFVQLVDLDEKRQTLKAIVWIPQRWHDSFLVWPEDKYEDRDYLVVTANDVWMPDLYVQNSLGNTDYTLDEFLLAGETMKIRPDGRVERASAFLLHTWCTVDVRFYPFDKQKCPIIISSWSYTEGSMNLSVSGAFVEKTLDNSEWSVVGITYETLTRKYECCEERYPETHFWVHLERKPSYFVVILVAPLIMLHILSTFAFLVPPDSGERLSYGLTTFLALSVFSLTIGDKVPESSMSIPVLSVNLVLAMVCNLISLLWSVLVIRCWGQNATEDCCFKMIYSCARKVAPLLCVWQVCSQRSSSKECDCSNKHAPDNPDNTDQIDLKLGYSCRGLSPREAETDHYHTEGASASQKITYSPQCRCKFVLRVVDKLFFVVFLTGLLLSEFALVLIFPMQD